MKSRNLNSYWAQRGGNTIMDALENTAKPRKSHFTETYLRITWKANHLKPNRSPKA